MRVTELDLTAWGGTVHSRSLVAEVASIEDCEKALEIATTKQLSIALRGNGCSHADPCQNDGGMVINTTYFNRILAFSEESGLLTVEPGVSFADALRVVVPVGWIVPCAPGSLDVTFGGAMSFDVHGKDSLNNGSFGDHIMSFKVLDASGNLRHLDRQQDKEIFDVVVGGMGLFGIVVEITLQLQKIPSSFLDVTKTSTRSVIEALQLLDNEEGPSHDYAIGWMDTFASGSSVGRGFMTAARWSRESYDVSGFDLTKLLSTKTKMFGILESRFFWRAAKPFFRPLFVRWANFSFYMLGQLLYGKGSESKKFFSNYIYIHNMIPDVNKVYQPEGLVTCQLLIPRDLGHDAVLQMLTLCQKHDIASMMAGLKRRRNNDRPLSFAGDGYSFSIDITRRRFTDKDLTKRLSAVYEAVLDLGGVVYLAKDDRLPANYFKQMYPRWQEFWKVKEKVDPSFRFMNDQARRLFEVD